MMKGVMGQQNSCKTLSGVHSTMHLIRHNYGLAAITCDLYMEMVQCYSVKKYVQLIFVSIPSKSGLCGIQIVTHDNRNNHNMESTIVFLCRDALVLSTLNLMQMSALGEFKSLLTIIIPAPVQPQLWYQIQEVPWPSKSSTLS